MISRAIVKLRPIRMKDIKKNYHANKSKSTNKMDKFFNSFVQGVTKEWQAEILETRVSQQLELHHFDVTKYRIE